MKVKDIATMIVCGLIVAGAIFYIVNMSAGNKPKTEDKTVTEKQKTEFTGDLDKYKDAMDGVQKSTDYGKPSLEGIGKANPFAPAQ